MKTSFAAALAFAAAVVLGWPEPSAAYDFFYDQNCAQCHGPTRTCSGCHAHGAHGLANKQDMNVVATANKASFTAGEEVVVTVTAGYRCGWVRMLLLDGQMATLAESSGAGGLGNGADSCTPGGITLRAPAPSAPGRYTWYAAWYGNTYDLDDRTTGAVAAFGQNFRSGPGVNHGRELVPLTVTVAAGGAPAAALAPTSLAFPRVKVGATAPLSARIQNTGTAVLKVTGVTRCDDAAAAPFSWSLATPLSIAPGGEATLPVTYQPTAAASSTSCLRLATNDPANPALQLGVTGAADPASPGVPGVALSASTLSFGTGVLAGTYATRTFDVQSVGTANLDVTGIAPCDGTTAGMFTFTSPLPGTIAPAEARTVTVSYTPTAAGTHSGCLTVATSAGPIDVRLSGAATMPAVTCTSCHGGTANATGAPPTDTHGETAASRRGVGAHTAHLNTQMSPTTARQSADCTACHQAVPSFTSPLHRDGSTDVPFGGVAKGGGLNPSWNPQTPTCGTVYCHGATLADGTNTAPTWTSVGVGEAACGRCHGV
ncbi:MAG: choice-of-anchor D domain-containing protein, partial [Anaeromyxobacteraceae bacterium]